MSFSDLHDIFSGRIGSNYCVKSLLYLKSSRGAKEYLAAIHKITFEKGDISRRQKWSKYPHLRKGPPVDIISERDLLSSAFLNIRSDKLSFDISRFTEFLAGYNKVDEDIKPVMLHYALIYLFDFFSATWLKYEQNRGHGIVMIPSTKKRPLTQISVTVKQNGIFPRAVDAFYFLGQSSLFSLDNHGGIGYYFNPAGGGTISKRIRKMQYSASPTVSLSRLVDLYERFGKIVGHVSKSNYILVGYVILFTLSSICRYRAQEWFRISKDRNLKSKFELLQYDFVHEWIPEILMQTILTKNLQKELSISAE